MLPDFLTGYFLTHTHTWYCQLTTDFPSHNFGNSTGQPGGTLSLPQFILSCMPREMDGPELRQTALPLLSQTNSDCEAKENRVNRATLPCVPQSQSPPSSSSSTSSSLLLSPILAIRLAANTDLSTQPYFSPRFFPKITQKYPWHSACFLSFLCAISHYVIPYPLASFVHSFSSIILLPKHSICIFFPCTLHLPTSPPHPTPPLPTSSNLSLASANSSLCLRIATST